MFLALLAHPQEARHRQHLVYCACVRSVGYTLEQPTDNAQTIYQVPLVERLLRMSK
jgi:hypothetical protein